MLRSISVLCGALVLAVGASASPAGAGGWATVVLDELSTPPPGQEVTIAFTVLAHGRTPADVFGPAEVVVTSPAGATERFPVTHLGETGRYGATVVFPGPGTHRWAVHTGGTVLADLGPLTVEPLVGGGGGGPWSGRAPAGAALAMAAVLATLAVAEVGRARRPRIHISPHTGVGASPR